MGAKLGLAAVAVFVSFLAPIRLDAQGCYDPCQQYVGVDPQALIQCCQQNPDTPTCNSQACAPNCYQQHQTESDPQLGYDMQNCCAANPGDISCQTLGYIVVSNQGKCGACAPPSQTYGSFTLSGWAGGAYPPGTTIQVYIDPSLDNQTVGGQKTTGAVQAIEAGINQAAGQLGYAVQYSLSPLAAGTGYTIALGGTAGDPCPSSGPACTQTHPRASSGGTAYAATWIELQNWGSLGFAASQVYAGLTRAAIHEFLHSDGLDDDYDYKDNCQTVTYGYYGFTPSNPQPTGALRPSDLCAATDGKLDSGGTGGGSGGGSLQCTAAQPNYTCTCDAAANQWNCECPGTPGTCADGSQQVCSNGSWTCGSSTNTIHYCVGQAPNCGSGGVANCEPNPANPNSTTGVWACQGGPCDGAIAPTCDYQPGCNPNTHGLYCTY